MFLSTGLAAEIKHTSRATLTMLERVPEDRLDWKPHEKSMTLGRLVSHVAELTQWIQFILNEPGYDFASRLFNRRNAETKEELLLIFDDNIREALLLLGTATDELLNEKWTMRNGDQVMFNLPRKVAIRELVMNHIIHHRGQLSVYLRLLNIPVPGMYGQSADEKG